MDVKSWIELMAGIALAVAPVAVLVDRYVGDRGIGARAIQFLTVAMLLPAIVILALEKTIEGATVGTLIGALTGYILSGIGEYRSDSKKKAADDEPPPVR
jgi:hypothetical protein